MAREQTILLVDGPRVRLEGVAERVQALGFRAVRAKTPEEAVRLAEDARLGVAAVLIAPQLAVADLPAALGSLRARASRGPLSFVAVGPRPESGILQELRTADVPLALWEPFSDATLRFQVNRALAGLREVAVRHAQRVPAGLPAQIRLGPRVKPASVYTLSEVGAFLETQRPSMSGALVHLEMALPPGPVRLAGRVAYANVPGNLRRHNLPVGMALQFSAVAAEAVDAIRGLVASTAPRLLV